MSYPETLAFLMRQLPMYQRIGAAAYKADLGNTLKLLHALGNPERKFPAIHVAGTNGKGSVSHLIASCLQESGHRTGLYTSPHLKDFRERIKINGEMIPEEKVVDFVERYHELFEQIQPSFFEMTVGMAFTHFAEQEVDIAVIEAGMGGRLDSTNVLIPLLSIITNIGHDHMQFLGNNLAAIAKEKAGIFKPGIPAIVGETNPETLGVFRTIAREKGTPLHLSAHEVFISPLQQIPGKEPLVAFNINTLDGPGIERLSCPLTGWYQQQNFRTAYHALMHLPVNFSPPPDAIIRGFRGVKRNTGFKGRWEILQQSPLVIADCAHNQEGLQAAMAQWMQIPATTRHIVLGLVDDKDMSAVFELLPRDARYYFCRPQVPRGMDVKLLQKEAAKFGRQGETYSSVNEALTTALNKSLPSDSIYIGGSTFVVAEIL